MQLNQNNRFGYGGNEFIFTNQTKIELKKYQPQIPQPNSLNALIGLNGAQNSITKLPNCKY